VAPRALVAERLGRADPLGQRAVLAILVDLVLGRRLEAGGGRGADQRRAERRAENEAATGASPRTCPSIRVHVAILPVLAPRRCP